MIRRRIVLVETRRTAAASETLISGAMGIGLTPSVPKAANLSGGGCDCVGSARSRSSAHDGILLIPTDAADPSTRSAPVRITGADPDCCLGLPLGVQAFKGRSASSAGRPRSRSSGVCGMLPLKDLLPRAAAPFFGRHGPFPMPSGLPQTTASERSQNRRSFSGGLGITARACPPWILPSHWIPHPNRVATNISWRSLR